MDISRIINRILYLVFHAGSIRDAHAKFYYRQNHRKRDQRVILHYFLLRIYENIFQALDGEEPQFSAYGQQTKNIITYFLASLITGFVVLAGFLFFIIPGIYLALRLQFFQAFIIEENAGIIESLHKSWEITRGQVLPLFMLALVMIGIMILGCILFGIGIFVAVPLIYMMYGYVFRKLNTPLQILE